MIRSSEYWHSCDDSFVRCGLCPHRCLIKEGTAGVCGIRENCGGELIASGYGQVSSVALDPIEKKPLNMFHPGKFVLSIGGFGCNLCCPFCQNSDISLEFSRRRHNAQVLSPADIIKLAKETVPHGNIGVAFTYNEPFVGYEFMFDTAKLVRDSGLSNIIVTNGHINIEPLEALLPYVDAMNIDLKSFSSAFYSRVGGELDVVKNTIALSLRHCHVEVTTLVIPGENEDSVEEIAAWLASLDPGIPLHLSRFFPRHKYAGKAPTPRGTMHDLSNRARKHLKHVF